MVALCSEAAHKEKESLVAQRDALSAQGGLKAVGQSAQGGNTSDSRIDLTALCSEREARALAEKKSLRYRLIYLFSARQNASIVLLSNFVGCFQNM